VAEEWLKRRKTERGGGLPASPRWGENRGGQELCAAVGEKKKMAAEGSSGLIHAEEVGRGSRAPGARGGGRGDSGATARGDGTRPRRSTGETGG
jgi:hypothetical protein